jgi:hypothetical protein
MKRFAELFTVVVFIVAFVIPVFAASDESMEVPTGSWEYGAIEQLAAKGYFPDYSGKPTNRGEAASMLASALPVDMTQVSEEDVDMLERLVEEFRAELAYQGVIVNALDDVDINIP